MDFTKKEILRRLSQDWGAFVRRWNDEDKLYAELDQVTKHKIDIAVAKLTLKAFNKAIKHILDTIEYKVLDDKGILTQEDLKYLRRKYGVN